MTDGYLHMKRKTACRPLDVRSIYIFAFFFKWVLILSIVHQDYRYYYYYLIVIKFNCWLEIVINNLTEIINLFYHYNSNALLLPWILFRYIGYQSFLSDKLIRVWLSMDQKEENKNEMDNTIIILKDKEKLQNYRENSIMILISIHRYNSVRLLKSCYSMRHIINWVNGWLPRGGNEGDSVEKYSRKREGGREGGRSKMSEVYDLAAVHKGVSDPRFAGFTAESSWATPMCHRHALCARSVLFGESCATYTDVTARYRCCCCYIMSIRELLWRGGFYFDFYWWQKPRSIVGVTSFFSISLSPSCSSVSSLEQSYVRRNHPSYHLKGIHAGVR